MRRSLAVAVLAATLTFALARTARADDDYVSIPDPVLRLDAVLHTQHDRAEQQRIFGGASIALLGGVAVGGGVAFTALATDDTARYLGIILASGGVAYLVIGIGTLMVTSPPEDRWAQWRALRARGAVPHDELARYEGELRLEAREESLQRSLGAVAGFSLTALGLGVTLGDVLLPSFTATSVGTSTALLLGIGIGIGLSGLLVGILSLLIEPPSVKELRMYLHGMVPRRSDGPTVQVAPMVGPTSGGLALTGTF